MLALLQKCGFVMTSYEIRDPASAYRTMVVMAQPASTSSEKGESA
jgi:hypothetical protein